jgi:hypothetical protein
MFLTLAMCCQLDLSRIGRDTLEEGLGYATKTVKVALPDVMFALVLLWFLARCVQLRAWKRLWWPPLACWALLFALVISLLHSPTIWASLAEGGKDSKLPLREGIVEIAQWVGYFFLAPWLFVNLMLDRRVDEPIFRRRLALGTLAAATLASIAFAIPQLWTFKESAPRGLWSSPGAFAGFLAFVTPLLLEAEDADPKIQRLWSAAQILIAAGIVFLVASIWAAAAVIAALVVAAYLRRGTKSARVFRLALAGGLAIALIPFWRDENRMQPYREPFLRLGDSENPVKKQYVEWQVATRWNVPRERAFATGFGPGNYQANIGKLYGYDAVPNEEKMPPDSNNLWLVQAVSLGIFGLGALIWVVSHFLKLAWRAAQTRPNDWLGAGVSASLCAWVLVNFHHALIVRGAGLVLAWMFAMAVVAAHSSHTQSNQSEVEPSKTR